MSAPGQQAESTTTPDAPESAPAEAPVTETTAAPGSDGLDRLYARMDEMAAQQRQMVDSLTELRQPPEEAEPELDYYDDEGGLTEDGARALIADLVREQVETQLAPREQARLTEMRDDAYEALKDEYPEMQDEAIARPILDRAVRWAMQVDERIIERPEFVDVIESFYKAAKFEEMRSQQEAEQPRPVVLEGAGGAARTTRGPQEPDWQKRVIEAAQRDGTRI
jgi:hypothetical protein